MKTKRILIAILLTVIALAILAACIPNQPVAVDTQANTPCYFALGGARFVAGNGCTINAQSGSTLQIDSGSAFQLGSTSTITNLTTTNLTATLATLTSAAIGGGFGSTGCTLSAAGVLQCDGAATIGGAATITGTATLIDAVTVGGGFGSTGCTLSAAGVLQCNGAMTIGGAATITGAVTIHGTSEINGNLDVDSFSTAGNMDITTMNNTGANPVTVNDNLVVTGTLSVNGATFSGPIKYGTAATYDNGASITHGFATTPTMCIIQPARDVTSTVTITATGFSSDMATVATPIYWMCGQ